MESKLEAFETWADAYISSLGQCDKITNEEVLNMVNTTSLLLPTIKKRKCQYFGHVVRARSIQKNYWKAKLKGREDGEDQEFPGCKNIKEWLGHTYNACVRRVEYPKSWRSMIANLYQQMELDDDDEVTLND